MQLSSIVGREHEIQFLNRALHSKEAELIAIYGRRRVGKTFLVREYFSAQSIYCEITGTKEGDIKTQLENFAIGLSKTFFRGIPIKTPLSWREAFTLLTKEIESLPKSKKIVIFFDEVPWLSSQKSGFMQNLDYFWNNQWSRIPNLKIVLCGSAASWMLDNLINAKGGLYNRLTKSILLLPFDLHHTRDFLRHRNIILNDKQILDIYMVTGGVPHYLKQIEKGKSAIQNINNLCFQKDGLLLEEFPKLFKALFDMAEVNLAIIREIAKHHYGVAREVLLKKLKITSGGTFNRRIKELEASGFIQMFIPYGRIKKQQYFRVIDEYSLFYLRWIEPYILQKQIQGRNYWLGKVKSASWQSWAGYAFENICYKHAEQIRQALGINHIGCEIGSWRQISKKGDRSSGAQVDLLFDRDDKTISLCEIKYSDKLFSIDKVYAKNIQNKILAFEESTKTKKQVFLGLITVVGMKKTIWSEELIQNVVLLKDLFVSFS